MEKSQRIHLSLRCLDHPINYTNSPFTYSMTPKPSPRHSLLIRVLQFTGKLHSNSIFFFPVKCDKPFPHVPCRKHLCWRACQGQHMGSRLGGCLQRPASPQHVGLVWMLVLPPSTYEAFPGSASPDTSCNCFYPILLCFLAATNVTSCWVSNTLPEATTTQMFLLPWPLPRVHRPTLVQQTWSFTGIETRVSWGLLTDILVKTDSRSERPERYVRIRSPPNLLCRYSGTVMI